jgi:hypothetical protein
VIKNPLTHDALRGATSHMSDFKAVHDGKGNYQEALSILRESLGIDTEAEEAYAEWLKSIHRTGEPEPSFLGGALLGLIMGLIAADYVSEAKTDTES